MKTKLQYLNSTLYHLYQFIKLNEYPLILYPGIMLELASIMDFLNKETEKEELIDEVKEINEQ